MADHLQEEEQLDAIKQWWQENRVSVVAAVVLTLGGSFGWSQYQDYTLTQSLMAADTYDTLLVQRADGESVEDLAALSLALNDSNGASAFAAFAALQVAAAAAEAGQFDVAKSELERVMEGTELDSTVGQLTQLRLAKVLSALGDEPGAMAILELGSDAFPVSYAQALGDMHLAAGREFRALEAYQTAQTEALALGSPVGLIDLKVNSLSLRVDEARSATDIEADSREDAAEDSAEGSAEGSAEDSAEDSAEGRTKRTLEAAVESTVEATEDDRL